MLNEVQLLNLLKSSETHWIERKKSFDPSEVKEVIVAFANAVPENQYAVLFIGVGPDGESSHIENADKTQIKISKIAEDECFPPLRCTPTIVRQGEREIIAVVMEFSKERPHFAGLPYVRVGSKTIKDRQKLKPLLEDLIASRNDKARRILREKDRLVTTVWRGYATQIPVVHKGTQASRLPPGFSARDQRTQRLGDEFETIKECRVESCDAHCLHLFEVATGDLLSASLENIKIDFDSEKTRTKLLIDNR